MYKTEGHTHTHTHTHTRGKIYHVHRLEELILLKWPYYPRQCTDSMQSLSKYQWHFHRSRKNNSTTWIRTQILKFV